MADKVELKVESRIVRGKGGAREARRTGLIPAVIYGNKEAAEAISVTPRDLQKEMNKKGFKTRQFELVLGSKRELALCQAIQYDKVSDQPIHIDFLRIDPNKELVVKIPFKFINVETAAGVKMGGVLNIVAHEVAIVCKPGNIVDEIIVDVLNLGIAESLHSEDITLPNGLKFEDHESFTIATIASAVEEVVAEAPAASAVPTANDEKKAAEPPKEDAKEKGKK